MNVKIGMPEILVVFSLVMYSQSFAFAITAFVLGLFARIIDYTMEYSEKIKQVESLNSSVEDMKTAVKDLFNADKD